MHSLHLTGLPGKPDSTRLLQPGAGGAGHRGQVSGTVAAMSLQSRTMASSSPPPDSSAASRTIRTWLKRVSGRWAPSQMSLMYRDTRNAAAAEEATTRPLGCSPVGWERVSHPPHGHPGLTRPQVATCGKRADSQSFLCLTAGLILPVRVKTFLFSRDDCVLNVSLILGVDPPRPRTTTEVWEGWPLGHGHKRGEEVYRAGETAGPPCDQVSSPAGLWPRPFPAPLQPSLKGQPSR